MTDVLDATESLEDLVPQDDSTPALNKDGSVRRKPGPRPGTRSKSGSSRRRAPGPGQRPPSAPKKASSGPDYRPAIIGIMQLPQLMLGLGARFVKDDTLKVALQLDGITVGIHTPNIAEALNTTAQTDENLAKILDKLSTVGPYSLVIAALLAPVGQILANHGVVATNPQMGILPADELMSLAQAMAG